METLKKSPMLPGLAVFLLTLTLLGAVQAQVPRPMLLAERFLPGSGWLEALLLALYGGFITDRMLQPRQSPLWRRRIWTLFSAVFFTQLLLGLAGFTKFLMTGALHMPVPALIAAGPVYRGGGFFMLTLLAATLLIIGPAWCSHLCYIGAWDNLFAQVRRKPARLPAWRERARLGILALALLTAAGLRAWGDSAWVATGLAAGFGLLGVALMAFWSRKTGQMAHCTSYCPIGVLATRFGRISPFRIRINSGCTDCGACTLACRYDALNKEDIKRRRPSISCTLCGDCIERCRGVSLEYRFAGLKPPLARTVFIVLAVTLHAVFLGVARI